MTPSQSWVSSGTSNSKTYVFRPCLSYKLSQRNARQLNPNVNAFQRSFLGEIRRIDEMARRLRFFATQIEKEKDVVPVRALMDSAPLITVGPRAAQTIDELDVTLKEHEARLMQMNSSYQALSERTRELVEARYVLRETAVFFEKVCVTESPL